MEVCKNKGNIKSQAREWGERKMLLKARRPESVVRCEKKLSKLTYPLCVTSVCLRPNFRNISTTVSIGVWSVTVIGAISRIFFNFNGGGPRFCTGVADVNNTTEALFMPSISLLAFPILIKINNKL